MEQLVKARASGGTLHVLRHGFKFYGKQIDLAVFQPAHGLNPKVLEQYAQNRLTVARQVHFDPNGGDTLDMVIGLNGLPVATVELKNPLTNQTYKHAIRQYKDRDARHPLLRFQRGALVHFAVDPNEVWMTTRLSGLQTVFLPFNRGHDHGAGNPPNPGGYASAYLWQDVWQRDSFLDIIARFVHLEKKTRHQVTRNGQIKKVTKETLIFPRYHQLDAVRKLIAATRDDGAGRNYLVQHSAGSGKSNSIAWLAHRLQSLHDDEDRKVFHSVVVITDRRVLDRQLQDTIYQIEHKQGVVARIDKSSGQLAEELTKGTAIIITTLQKFPFVTDHISSLPDRRYALIVDEAHSSQTGSSARQMKALLGSGPAAAAGQQAANDPYPASPVPASLVAEPSIAYAEPLGATFDPPGESEDQPPDAQDEIVRVMESRQRQKNLSFFAFTATPKHKTLEIFGHKPTPDGEPVPFHLYSMRQAIDEEFIFDVLQHYTTYKTYYGLVKTVEDDPRVEKSKARAALARYVRFHPHNVAQKTRIMAEHYRAHVRRKINGRAKAMVVTASRRHAVMYKRAFDRYLAERGYLDISCLVAFSGEVPDPEAKGKKLTEVGMNGGIPEKQLPERFATTEFQILIVANKYQTGFDQPLLHTMYVDKRLAGVQAIQALSRLNRRAPYKEDTFVLDFVNQADEIQRSFEDYYETTTIDESVDPHRLYGLHTELEAAQVFHGDEVSSFAEVFYRPRARQHSRDQAQLYRWLTPSVGRFKALEDEAREAFRGELNAYVRLYGFLSQVMPFTDADLERLYSFGRYLIKLLPRDPADTLDLTGDVELESYRISRTSEGAIGLPEGAEGELPGPSETGTSRKEDEDKAPLSEIIEVFNERYGTDFGTAERLLLEGVREKLVGNELVRQRAAANTLENFAIASDVRGAVTAAMVEHLDRHGDIVGKFLDDAEFQAFLYGEITKVVHEELREAG